MSPAILFARSPCLDPPYPNNTPDHRASSILGVCGQEFIDFPNWPEELQGMMVKVRYKPTNRVELLKWKEYEYGYEEEYLSDIIFSSNLSFIPVDLDTVRKEVCMCAIGTTRSRSCPIFPARRPQRQNLGANLEDFAKKGAKTVVAPKITGASLEELLDLLKRREYRYRYWAKRD